MNIQKTLLSGLAGGIVFLVLGYVVYGMLLMGYWEANTDQCMARAMDDFVWWAMIVSNIAYGLFLAIIMGWAGKAGLANGTRIGAVVGFMTGLIVDLMGHSMTTMFNDMTILVVDILVFTVVSAIVGAVVGMVLGMGSKSAE